MITPQDLQPTLALLDELAPALYDAGYCATAARVDDERARLAQLLDCGSPLPLSPPQNNAIPLAKQSP